MCKLWLRDNYLSSVFHEIDYHVEKAMFDTTLKRVVSEIKNGMLNERKSTRDITKYSHLRN